MEKILALKQYRHLMEVDDGGPIPASTLCPTDPRSIKFVEELYKEFVPLFEADDFNACCDETSDFDKGRSRRRAQRIGSGRVYLEFLLKIHRLCQKFGKRMNIWADIVLKHPELLKDLPRDIVMLNWEYESAGPRIARTKEIARAGLPFMVCPGTSAWLTHGSRLANAIGNVTRFATEGRRWGAEGLLNTDWGDLGHRNFLAVSLHGFAHGAAHSWHGGAVNDNTFTETFCFHTFGRRNERLANSLRLLGDSYRICSNKYFNSSALYRVLVEPLIGSLDDHASRINQTKPAGLRRMIENLSGGHLWPTGHGLDRFESLAMQEFALAARMDVLAARRALAAKELRAGRAVPKRQLLALADEMRQMARDFARLWLARNKPSCLRDNLLLFAAAEAECRRLAK